MGDLIGDVVEGRLAYLPKEAFDHVLSAKTDRLKAISLFADMCRLNALYMIARAGSGHIGSSFSSMEIMSYLLLSLKMGDSAKSAEGDVFFSSKGHDAPGYYSVLLATGKLPFEKIHQLRQLGGLPGHPDIHTDWIHTNTGSLGMGIAKAKGMLFAKEQQKAAGRIFVLTGDGELQEGQCWESLVSAANHRMDRLVVIVDHNKLQSDTFVSQVSDLGDLPAKFTAFGWHCQRIDGHDLAALERAIGECDRHPGKPHIIIADTIKGKGVSFMEHTSLDNDTDMYRFHSGAPDRDAYIRAAQELSERIHQKCHALGLATVESHSSERASPPAAAAETPQKLIPAYSAALLEQAAKHPNLIALDADLILDTGLIPFRERFPTRFVECGIAEQDMVSQAGGMALKGLLPVVHSFACFLSTRPNEQIYNNATEDTHIVYVGSLAGVIPGGPGHSHQAVRDIAALKGTPGMVMLEPGCEQEVGPCLDYVINQHQKSAYLRLCSVPWPVSFSLPKDYRLVRGQGCELTSGKDIVLFAYGPILLTNAVNAARELAQESVAVKVVNMPWLNEVDDRWFAGCVEGARAIVMLDNHYAGGGQAETLLAAAAKTGVLTGKKIVTLGVEGMPACGSPAQVLAFHGLDSASLAKTLRAV